jgi:hyperosmotically inducible periplasmic protein
MHKNTSILAATLAAMLFSGAALANENEQAPAKKPAAEAASSQPANDTWITTKVKSSLLADTAVSGTKLDVDTVNGVVFLTGTAGSQAQVDAAKKIAAGIEGVSKVDTTKVKVMAAR